MAHELHVKSNLCPQWVKAVQGLRYLREGLAPFCDDIAKQQYKDMIKKIQQTKTPQPTIPCVTCQITTLQPDHSHVSKKCPLKQDKCNCCFPNKKPCPNNVCGAIYDSIIRNHASIPPAPFWRNSDAQQWSADDPWSICKCFINAPGYKDKTSPFDTDCAGLLHVIINNKYFHSHIGCNVKGRNNLFSQVRQYRNEIFHSTSMELEESKANSYIDEMISILQDGKKLVYRQDAKQAVLKLQDLKKDFIITTKDLEEIVKQINEEIRKSTQNAATKEEHEELKNKLTALIAQISQTEEEHKELKRKFAFLETEQKKQTKRLKEDDSPQQKQLKYERAKSECRKILIEHYNKTLLHVSITPLQPQGEKCSFNEIYIRPKITREIKGENREIKEVEISTMSEMFTKNGFPQNSVYVVGDAGSGKTSFCKYLVNCWCLAHSEEHEAAYENEDGNGKNGGNGDKYGDDNENEGGNENHKERGSDIVNEDVNAGHEGYIENEGDNENHVGGKHVGDSKRHGGDNEEHEGDKKEYGGYSVKHRSDSEKQVRDNEEHWGDNEEHRGDSERNVGDSDKHGGDNEEHGGDIEEHGGDSDKNECDSEKHGDDNGEHGGVSKKNVCDSEKHGGDNDKLGGDIEEHGGDSEKNVCDSEPVYDSETYEQEFKAVNEMKKFDFLFYIPLRKYEKNDTIDEMLQKSYQMIILSTLLEEESSRVMILLDGLDEWSSENVPEHSIFRKYTIVTTLRPWKFHTLRSSDVEIEQSLKLEGFDFICEREMVTRTVSLLNSRRRATKKAIDCLFKLQEKSLESLKQVPIMLQQLICLWFDGKLDKTSRCAIYTGMLELFFTWNDMKTTGTSTRLMECSQKVDLPKYLANKNKLESNRFLIYDVSQLAYETLLKCPKDKSLAFDICMFDELEISDEVRENCLKLGIMTEDECPSLSVSEPPSSLFSFIHKSVQEFLAAVFIGIKFNSKVGSSDCTGNDELAEGCSQFMKKIFQKCSANDILEQSNVIIMLCGLEPRLATHVSKYIYYTLSEDSDIQKYRRTLDRQRDDHTVFSFLDCKMHNNARFITDLQMLMFALIEECKGSCTQDSCPVFYIGDLVIDSCGQYCDIVCSCSKDQIYPDFVRSINIDYINPSNAKFTKHLRKFRSLEKIEITHERVSQMFCNSANSYKQMINCVAEIIERNILTLKSLSLGIDNSIGENNPVYKTVVSNLPSMINLVAISMTNTIMSHGDTTTFCNFLEEKSHLEQIYLGNVICESKDQHDVNLSKHQQLQYLHLKNAFSVTDASTTNLEIYRFEILEKNNYEKQFDIFRKSYKLKEFELYGDSSSKFELYESKYNTILTERLVKKLPFLHNLGRFGLWWCRLTDNIIQSPLEMKSLRDIKLVEVIMSLTTWQKFVDSLLRIPHTVDVSVTECYITGDGEELNDPVFPLTSQGLGGVKGKDAIQYVKDRDLLFHRTYDDNICPFYFSTKK